MDLRQIINTLMRVETRGENTLIMADCIRALAVMAEEIDNLKELKNQEDKNETVHDNE